MYLLQNNFSQDIYKCCYSKITISQKYCLKIVYGNFYYHGNSYFCSNKMHGVNKEL